MSDIKIDKGIPIPRGRKGGITDTISKMEIGDSFLISKSDREQVYIIANRVGVAVKTRADGDGCRVWRVA